MRLARLPATRHWRVPPPAPAPRKWSRVPVLPDPGWDTLPRSAREAFYSYDEAREWRVRIALGSGVF